MRNENLRRRFVLCEAKEGGRKGRTREEGNGRKREWMSDGKTFAGKRERERGEGRREREVWKPV